MLGKANGLALSYLINQTDQDGYVYINFSGLLRLVTHQPLDIISVNCIKLRSLA